MDKWTLAQTRKLSLPRCKGIPEQRAVAPSLDMLKSIFLNYRSLPNFQPDVTLANRWLINQRFPWKVSNFEHSWKFATLLPSLSSHFSELSSHFCLFASSLCISLCVLFVCFLSSMSSLLFPFFILMFLPRPLPPIASQCPAPPLVPTNPNPPPPPF